MNGAPAGSRKRARILILDNDDTLYRNNYRMSVALTKNIQHYCDKQWGINDVRAYAMYKTYGTTLKGLILEGYLKPEEVKPYIEAVHTFDNLHELIKPDPKLRQVIQDIQVEHFVFTAGPRAHAERCCEALGIADLLMSPPDKPVIDTEMCEYITKYSDRAFEICLERISKYLGYDVDPQDIIFVDDNVRNCACAKKNGWGTTILMGRLDRGGEERFPSDCVDHVIEHLAELPLLCPDIFSSKSKTAMSSTSCGESITPASTARGTAALSI